MDQTGKKSKLSYVLSAIQTTLYDIKECVSGIIQSTNEILCIGSTVNYMRGTNKDLVNHGEQTNYKCLVGIKEHIVIENNMPVTSVCHIVKQRTTL